MTSLLSGNSGRTFPTLADNVTQSYQPANVTSVRGGGKVIRGKRRPAIGGGGEGEQVQRWRKRNYRRTILGRRGIAWPWLCRRGGRRLWRHLPGRLGGEGR